MENNKKQEMMLGLKNAVAERDNINVQLCGMYIDLITDILCNNMPNKLFDLEKLQSTYPNRIGIASLLHRNRFLDFVDDCDNFGYTTGPIEMTIGGMYIANSGELYITGVDEDNHSSDYVFEREDYKDIDSANKAYLDLHFSVDLLAKAWDVINHITENYECKIEYTWKPKK